MFSVNQKTSDYMSIVVTHECNRKCPFCVDKYRGNAEYISMSTLVMALEFADSQGISDILIVGGEPTLHPDIVEICETVKAFGFRLIMTTNYSNPALVERLGAVVDCLNISFYGQGHLPLAGDLRCDVTIHTLIYSGRLDTKAKLDEFIDEHRKHGHLKFSTLSPCNEWATKMQSVPYLDDIGAEDVVLFDEMLGQLYRGCVIKRYDKVMYSNAPQSLKCHVDGEISESWDRCSV